MKLRKVLLSVFLVIVLIAPALMPVKGDAATIKISKTKLTLEAGKSATLKITGTKSKVTWSSSKKSVATVSSKGKVVAKKKGNTVITAKVSGKKYTCKVTVKSKITKYDEGMHKVGKDIPAGEYVLFSSSEIPAYFEVSSNSKGTFDSIICNDNFAENSIVNLKDGTYLTMDRCYAIPINEAKVDVNKSGMFKVGLHIKAGEYKIVSTDDIMAYMEVATNSTHLFEDIITNDNFNGSKYITVEDGQYLMLERCKID